MSIGNFTGDTLRNAAAQDGELDGMPGLIRRKPKSELDGYKFRIQQLRMTEPGDVAELERVCSKSIKDEGVMVWNKQTFMALDTLIVLIEYWEKIE